MNIPIEVKRELLAIGGEIIQNIETGIERLVQLTAKYPDLQNYDPEEETNPEIKEQLDKIGLKIRKIDQDLIDLEIK